MGRSGDMGELEEEVRIGQEITVMIQEIDHQGRLNLSRRALFGGEAPPPGPNGGPRAGFAQDRGRPGGDRGRRPGGRPGFGGSGGRPGFGGPRPGGGDRRFQGGRPR